MDLYFKKYANYKTLIKLIPYLKNDKKNDDDKINFILIKKLEKLYSPNKINCQLQNIKLVSLLLNTNL